MNPKIIMLKRVGCGADLGSAGKMPCSTYSLPAQECKVGQALAKIPGSVCSGCYADNRGNYSFPVVKNAMYRRLDSITLDTWVDDMTQLIAGKNNPFFRWHDSGDLQSLEHLKKINQIALNLPGIKFWLPTRELGIVSQFMRECVKAPNLIIRVSAMMINGPAKDIAGLPKSYVHTGIAARVKGVKVCPAPKQDGRCGECRNCWNPNVDISYHKH